MQDADYADMQSPALLAPYLSYEYAASGNYAPTHAAGIGVVAYENPFMPQNDEWDEQAALRAYPDVEAKTCGSQTVTTYGDTGQFADLSVSDISSYIQDVVTTRTKEEGSAPDIVFFDNANDLYGVSALPCAYKSPAQWTSLLALALTPLSAPPIVLNTLSVPSAYENPPPGVTYANQIAGLGEPTVLGGEYEGGYVDSPKYWVATEDAEIDTVRAGKLFWSYSDGAWSKQQAAQAITQRLYVYASFLLTYDPSWPKQFIFQEWLQTPSNVHLFPEVLFMVAQPAYSASDVSGYHYSGGAYERTFNACGIGGMFIGECVVAVNPGSTTVPLQYIPATLQHSVMLSGGGILDGGTIAADGPAVTSLAPGTAAILTP